MPGGEGAALAVAWLQGEGMGGQRNWAPLGSDEADQTGLAGGPGSPIQTHWAFGQLHGEIRHGGDILHPHVHFCSWGIRGEVTLLIGGGAVRHSLR